MNGIKIIKNEDGSITLNGTATANFALYYNKDNMILEGDYIFYLIGKNGKINLQGRENGTAVAYITYVTEQEYATKRYEEKTVLTELFSYIQANQTFNNETFKVMITKSSEVKSYIPHQSQTHTIYTQQKFLEGDTFVKKDKKWYEKHNFGYVSTLNHDPIVIAKNSTSTDNFFRYMVGLGTTDKKIGTVPLQVKMLCTHFNNANSRWSEEEGICGWENGSSFCVGTIDTGLDTSEKLKEYLLSNDVGIYYELAEPILLECTAEQIAQLNALEASENYKADTIVYSTDEVSPKFNITYRKDLETVQANDKAELQEQIDEIKALLSTTETSAMLLDNMQAELESEVE